MSQKHWLNLDLSGKGDVVDVMEEIRSALKHRGETEIAFGVDYGRHGTFILEYPSRGEAEAARRRALQCCGAKIKNARVRATLKTPSRRHRR